MPRTRSGHTTNESKVAIVAMDCDVDEPVDPDEAMPPALQLLFVQADKDRLVQALDHQWQARALLQQELANAQLNHDKRLEQARQQTLAVQEELERAHQHALAQQTELANVQRQLGGSSAPTAAALAASRGSSATSYAKAGEAPVTDTLRGEETKGANGAGAGAGTTNITNGTADSSTRTANTNTTSTTKSDKKLQFHHPAMRDMYGFYPCCGADGRGQVGGGRGCTLGLVSIY